MTHFTRVQVGYTHNELGGDRPRSLDGKHKVYRVLFRRRNVAAGRFLHEASVMSVGTVE